MHERERHLETEPEFQHYAKILFTPRLALPFAACVSIITIVFGSIQLRKATTPCSTSNSTYPSFNEMSEDFENLEDSVSTREALKTKKLRNTRSNLKM
ncbi:hypothetical protein Glove_709g97 [Diversispora epigaea]|uniref:Transmembrane protein n=1 Tax=Diversispora epigaea TaxID=1348612 RepID=A0A397G157_9GLOM|nr:hypothetical protein Glove_709g97 [Diversispora epigaea]